MRAFAPLLWVALTCIAVLGFPSVERGAGREHYSVSFRSVAHAAFVSKSCEDLIAPTHWHVALHGPLVSAVRPLYTASVFASRRALANCLERDVVRRHVVGGQAVETHLPSKMDERVMQAVSPRQLPDDMWPDMWRGSHLVRLTAVVACDDVDASEAVDDVMEHVRQAVAWYGDSGVELVTDGHSASHTSRSVNALCRHGSVHVILPLRLQRSRPRVPPRLIVAIASASRVRWLEPAPRFTAANRVATKTMQSETPGDIRPIWSHNVSGAGEIVSVGDTGVDWDSCFFDDPNQDVAIWPSVNYKHRKIISYVPCVDSDTGAVDVMDAPDAHGTHVTGSVAGNALYFPRRSREAASIVADRGSYDGMARHAKVFFYDLTCGASVAHQDMLPPGDLYDFYAPAYAAGARVSSNSWGDNGGPKAYTAVLRRTDQFAYDHPDQVLVFAAGNSAMAGVISPAAGKSVLTVGAHPNTELSSNRDTICSFSARGLTFDHRIKPDLLAPGQTIVSAMSDGNHDTHQCQTMSLFGTSMACPLVAGSAALLREYLRLGYYPSGTPNPADALARPLSSTIRAALVHASRYIHMADIAPVADQGWGRLRLGDVFVFNEPPHGAVAPHLFITEEVPGLAHREQAVFCVGTVNVATRGPTGLRVTLSWTDPAFAAEGSTRSVINDLDLVVVSTLDGSVHRANGRNEGFDADNVVEKVIVASPRNGFYTVIVSGHYVQPASSTPPPRYQGRARHYNGTQAFSLVITAPGITVDRGSCATKYAQHPPPLPLPQSPMCAAAAPGKSQAMECFGHGACYDGLCRCERGYFHADCSLCDAELLCNGNGACTAAATPSIAPQCRCAANVDPTSVDCSKCATGWFGPHCDSKCDCVHGECDLTAGRCKCDKSPSTGWWAGERCARCEFDRLRVAVDATGAVTQPLNTPRCSVPAVWCENREVRHVLVPRFGPNAGRAFIVINDNPTYDNSMTCRWVVRAESPYHRVHLAFPSFQIENPFDSVQVVLGEGGANASNVLAEATGSTAPAPLVVDAGAVFTIIFRADYLGNNFSGFVAVIWTDPRCVDTQCSGHGRCDAQGKSCLCDTGYDPAFDCSKALAGTVPHVSTSPPAVTTATGRTPNPLTGHPSATSPPAVPPGVCDCNGHGRCSPGSTTCDCDPPYAGPRCDVTCPAIDTDGDGRGIVPCSRNGRCSAGGVCQCDDGYQGVACQVDPQALTVLSPMQPAARLVAPLGRNSTSPTMLFARYSPATRLPLPFPLRQLLRVRIVLTWARSAASASASSSTPFTWTLALWNDLYHAAAPGRHVATRSGVLDPSSSQQRPPQGACLDVWGWNADDARSTTVTVQLHKQLLNASAPNWTPLLEASEHVDNDQPQLAADCLEGRLCRVADCADVVATDAPAAALGNGSAMTPAPTRRHRVYDVFQDPTALLYLAGGFSVAFVVTLVGFVLARRASRRQYAVLQAADGEYPASDVAGPAEFGDEEMPSVRPVGVVVRSQPRDIDRGSVTDSDDDDALDVHPAVSSTVSAPSRAAD